jgi:hypothetical protein
MDTKQKIMRLIIEKLKENQPTEYSYTGSATTLDPNVLSMEFIAKQGVVCGEFNIWGMVEVPLELKAQYDSRSILNDYPRVQAQIQSDLDDVSVNISRLL